MSSLAFANMHKTKPCPFSKPEWNDEINHKLELARQAFITGLVVVEISIIEPTKTRLALAKILNLP